MNGTADSKTYATTSGPGLFNTIDFRPKYAASNMTNTTNTTVDFWTICREPNLVHSLIAVNTLLVVVGIFSNCLVAAVVWKVKLMQNPTNLLLSNNAIAEAIFLVISGTDLVMQLLAKDIFTLSEVLLYFEVRGPFYGVTVASFFVASINIALLAIERFNALCYPLKIRRRLGKRSTKCCIATMWLVMTILMLPLTVGVIQGQGFVDVKLFIYYCTLNGTIPAFTGFTIIYCYGRIIYGMYITKSIFNPTCSTNISEDHKAKRNIVKMLLSITFTFVITKFPLAVQTTLVLFGKDNCLVNYKFAATLAHLSAFLNPLIYLVFSSNYRKEARKLFNGCFPQSQIADSNNTNHLDI